MLAVATEPTRRAGNGLTREKEDKMRYLRSAATALILAASIGAASAQSPGVTDKEIRVGTIQDLSGPIVQLSKQAIDGMQMRIEEVNAAGGVNGRQIKLFVEDSGYDPKRAVLAAQKLIEQTGVFAMLGTIGSPTGVATLPILEEAKVLNLFPLSAHAAMSEPLPLRWANGPRYDQMMHVGVKFMVKTKSYKSACILYQDDDFGQEVFRGATEGLKDLGMRFKETTSYKRGATDFSSQVAKMRSADCDLVVLGAILREPPLIVAEAKKIGWNPDFLSSVASHTTSLAKLGGKDLEGFYAIALVKVPYLDDEDPAVRNWANKFEAKFNLEPDVLAVYGWQIVDLFARSAEAAGRDLTTDAYIKTIESYKGSDIFGASVSFAPNRHQGSASFWIAQIKNGRWINVTAPIDINGS
jgi:branched-chain amino acid transport system substrate-binding protein